MPTKVTKKIQYLRAFSDNQLLDLETVLRRLVNAAPSVHDSQILLYGQITQILRRKLDLQDDQNNPIGGLLLHIGNGTRDERMKTMRNQANDAADDEGGVQAPPAGHSFLSREAFIYINRHHVLLCSHGLRAGSVASYLQALSQKLHNDNESLPLLAMEFHAVANFNKLNMIQEHGVKYISLNATAHELSINNLYQGSQTPLARNLQRLTNLFNRELTEGEREAMEEVQAGIWLKLKGNSRASVEARQLMKQQAEAVVRDEDIDNGFFIETQDGQKIEPNDVKLSKPVRLTQYEQANTLLFDDAFKALLEYFSELNENNLIEI